MFFIKLKKSFNLFFLILLLICNSSPIYAHPGRTDSNGGHVDKSTGQYHYHHGYEAHYHINGKCPYDYDDKTGHSSGSSGGSTSGSTNKTPTETSPPKREPETTASPEIIVVKEKDNSDVITGIFSILVILFIFAIFWGIIKYYIKRYDAIKEFFAYQSLNKLLNYKPRSQPRVNSNLQSAPKTQSLPAETHVSQRVLPPIARDNYDGYWKLKYQYDQPLCLYGSSIDKVLGLEGKLVDFKQEPLNSYDHNAIAVYRKNERIGYIYKGQTQDMMNEWFAKKYIIVGFIKAIYQYNRKVTISIAFYEPCTPPQLTN